MELGEEFDATLFPSSSYVEMGNLLSVKIKLAPIHVTPNYEAARGRSDDHAPKRLIFASALIVISIDIERDI